ncbi:hypothetical protein CROQUDRAFT_102588 [Cronartium quercuum f. sp. fusiforme G11]|uniref:Uncharacterized protein n=1 Tax=Cronartium quercuum f. sp. fusiforme G11 TaxID=708437 RepID=A0A9P6N5I5_9BASI|nr:hypothetical protein CROQUDRAFT_102588 [Cronartium quercuum f. sp. fusiforme G11]
MGHNTRALNAYFILTSTFTTPTRRQNGCACGSQQEESQKVDFPCHQVTHHSPSPTIPEVAEMTLPSASRPSTTTPNPPSLHPLCAPPTPFHPPHPAPPLTQPPRCLQPTLDPHSAPPLTPPLPYPTST